MKIKPWYFQPEVDGTSPCARCPNSLECVSCSAIVPSYNRNYRKSAPDLRKWWAARVKHMKQPETEAMRRGREIHEVLASERHVTEDLNEVFAALGEVGRTVLWTARLCSCADGIRGQPDWVESTRTAPDRIYHKVVEAKSHPDPHRKYFPQGCAYALVLSNPRMIANGLYFYDYIPGKQTINIDVDFDLFYYSSGKAKSYHFVRDWKFMQGAGYVFGVKRLIKKFSGLTRVKEISSIPRCGFCLPIDSKKSSVYGGPKRAEDLCHVWPLCRADLLVNVSSKQYKLGRWVRKAKAPPQRNA